MNKLDHAAFRVSNLDKSLKFYAESLGLRLLSRDVNLEEQEAFAFLELEGGNLELIQTLDADYTPPLLERPHCPHLALQTQDMASVLEMLKTNGVPILKGPLEIPGEEKWLYICDPDSNVIEYIQWMREA